jgi:flagellin
MNPIALSTVKLAQQAGNLSNREIQKVSQMLSTGQRIQSAADDAVGVALQQHFSAEIRAVAQVSGDIHRGLGLAQVAETGLRHITSALQRMRELAVQASNGTYTNDQRNALNAEYGAMRAAIDATTESATIFERFPLAKPEPPDPTSRGAIGNTSSIVNRLENGGPMSYFNSGVVSLCYVPQGLRNVTLTMNSFGNDDDLQIFTKNGTHLTGTPVGGTTDIAWTRVGVSNAASATSQVLTAVNGFNAGATYDGSNLPPHGTLYDTATPPLVTNYNGMTLRYSGDGNYSDTGIGFNDGSVPVGRQIEKVTIDTVTEDLIILSVGAGAFEIQATWDTPQPEPAPRYSTPISVLVGASGGQMQYLTIEPAPSDMDTLGVATTEISTASQAQSAISRIDAALQTVGGYNARFASYQSRLMHAADGLQEVQLQFTQSRSVVADADMAAGSANLAKAQVLYDASQRVMGIAHRASDAEFRLMRDTFRALG